MIQISGMEEGSGGGFAAGRKAGWLPRGAMPAQVFVSVPAQPRASNPRGAAPPVFQPAPSAPPPAPRPPVGPDGRPLPPDGSAPPPRPATQPAAPAPAAPGGMPASNLPRPPDGSAPPLRRTMPIARLPGTPLPAGTGPAAPPGHSFEARPAAAPPGEFLFDLRCSCGGTGRAVVPAAALMAAAARGLPAADAIAIATQDALDAMHRA